MAKRRKEDLLRASTRILTMLLAVDENEGVSLKHLRLIQLIKKCEDHKEPCTSALLGKLTGWPRSTVSRLLADLAGYDHDRHPAFIKFVENTTNRRYKLVRSTEVADQCRERVLDGLKSALDG